MAILQRGKMVFMCGLCSKAHTSHFGAPLRSRKLWKENEDIPTPNPLFFLQVPSTCLTTDTGQAGNTKGSRGFAHQASWDRLMRSGEQEGE